MLSTRAHTIRTSLILPDGRRLVRERSVLPGGLAFERFPMQGEITDVPEVLGLSRWYLDGEEIGALEAMEIMMEVIHRERTER